MKAVLFIDTICPKPYGPFDLKDGGMGGTEATVIRVAEKLAETCTVVVAQKGRTEKECHKAVYMSLTDAALMPKYDAVVVLRSAMPLRYFKNKYKDAKVFLWLHDLAGGLLASELRSIKEIKPTIITVSGYHKTQVIDTLKAANSEFKGPVITVYNPIDDDLTPFKGEVDKNKLVFFSSPHKGLDYAVKTFGYALNLNPDFQLHVANPGYYPDGNLGDGNRIVNHGALPHSKGLDLVRNALCVFYPNHVFPETFGLVFAEANALGTPVLTHRLGAAHEVLDHPAQLVDTRNVKEMIDRLMAWHSGNRPTVRGKPQFRLTHVIGEWRKLLEV